jgi:AcrR family transcriptional regulator
VRRTVLPRKGELTRQAILEKASALASREGLDGVTIGLLADELGLSKSGLFAHFRSKEQLQVQILEHTAQRFVDTVVRPALSAPRGEPRVRALFDHWLGWAQSHAPAGCLFVAAATELDDHPGPARDRLVRSQRDWMDTIATCFRTGIAEGHFVPDADPDQFAYSMYGVALAYHHAARLLGDPMAMARARAAFEDILEGVRVPASPAARKTEKTR